MLIHIDLFSGIGGFALACQWAGIETVAFCEKDEYCQAVLRKHWPEVPIVPDIKKFKRSLADYKSGRRRQDEHGSARKAYFNRNGEAILLTGGFPCQPFSVAGKRRGKEDDRFLWPEMFRIIKKVRPDWILAENVAGIVHMVLDDCLSNLESEDYSTGTVIIPACAVNAPHRRDRVWIVGHSQRMGLSRIDGRGPREKPQNGCQNVADTGQARTRMEEHRSCRQTRQSTDSSSAKILRQENGKAGPERIASGSWWATEPDVGRVAYGVPARVDRLRGLGNAIVPQVAYEIIKAIAETENDR